MRKKCPYSELFWSAFFLHFPASSPKMEKCGKNADENNSEYEHFLRSTGKVLWKIDHENWFYSEAYLGS